MRKVVFLGGPPKTGSSALQSLCNDLLGTDPYYPKVAQWGDHSHHPLVFSYFEITAWDKNPKSFDQLTKDLVDEINSQATLPETIVISSEAAIATKEPDRFFHAICEDLNVSPENFLVCLTFRHPAEIVQSRYNQNIKDPNDEESRLFSEFFKENYETLGLNRFLERTSFPVKVFDHFPQEDYCRRVFTNLFGLELSNQPQENISMSFEALVYCILAKRKDPQIYASKFRKIIQFLPVGFNSNYSILSDAQTDLLDNFYGEEITYLKDKYNITGYRAIRPKPAKFSPDAEVLEYIGSNHGEFEMVINNLIQES